MAEIRTVAVIGAGTMGSGIAQVFAKAGFQVLLCDMKQEFLDRGMAAIRASLGREAAKQKISPQEMEMAIGRISPAVGHDRMAGADMAIEAATERFAIKVEILQSMDRILPPEAIIATNTSSISITKLAAQTGRPTRVIGMHFFNPVPVMSLVEVVRGLETAEDVFVQVRDLSVRLGKTPVEVNDAPGFVSNRVLLPLINEAAFAVMEGVATPEAVDQVFKLGMAHPMGPLALADLIGLDVCVDILKVLQEGYGDAKFRPCPLLVKMVDAGWLGRKSGRGFYTYN